MFTTSSMPLSAEQGLQKNILLGAIPADALQLFRSDVKERTFNQGVVLQEAGEPIEHIYFPQNGMISLLVVTLDGGAIEAATIGREGSVGMHGGFGGRRAFTRAVAQITSKCFYVSAESFHEAAAKSAALAELMTRYTEALWMESQQLAACNAKHSAEARLCRWFLQTRDRIESDTLPLTQEFLSEMLGVRRTTVTLVARALQEAGIIKYHRGVIHIMDVDALKKSACECYAVLDQAHMAERLRLEAHPA
jgi:CRP-like cAMP-binding protein